jgi:hypothetical protein
MEMSPLNGAHTTFPLGKMAIPSFSKDKFASQRDIVMIVDESLVNECQEGEARQMVWFVDATVETKPMVVASYSVPETSENFCERGGRFGSHSSNESMAPVFYKKLAFVTWFNAGSVRSIYEILIILKKLATSSQRLQRQQTSVASRSMGRMSVRLRYRATMLRPMSVDMSMLLIEPIPDFTFSK